MILTALEKVKEFWKSKDITNKSDTNSDSDPSEQNIDHISEKRVITGLLNKINNYKFNKERIAAILTNF